MTIPFTDTLGRLLGYAQPHELRPYGAHKLQLLTPLLELVPPAPPPPGLLPLIENQIGTRQRPLMAPRLRLAMAWMLGAASGAAAVFALIQMSDDRGLGTPLPLTIVNGAERVAMLSARTLQHGQYLRIDHFGLRADASGSLELWLLQGSSGRLRPLGLLASDSGVTVIPLAEAIESGDLLAFSEEEPGGSSDPGPSGPVVVTARVGAAN